MSQTVEQAITINTELYLGRINQIVYAYRGRSLSSLESYVIRSCIKGESYKNIADAKSYDSGYVCDLARKIYRILGRYLGQKVGKFNLLYICESYLDGEAWERLKSGIIKANT